MQAREPQSPPPALSRVLYRRQDDESAAFRTVALLAGLVTAIGGLVSLLGWILDLHRLTDWSGQGITIKANTSIGLVLLGSGLALASFAKKARAATRALGGLAAALGGVTLLEHLTNIDFGIDTLLFNEPVGALGTTSPGRMGVPASTSFMLLGLSLIFASSAKPIWRRRASILGLCTLAIASLPLAGYLYGASQLYAVARYTGIALQTASMLWLLAVGVIALVQDVGLGAQLRRRDTGGLALRRMLIPVTLLPFALGWAWVWGENAGLYDAGMGAAALILMLIATLVAVVWATAASVSASEEAAREAEGASVISEQKFASVFQRAPLAMVLAELPEGRYTEVNEAWERLFEFTRAEAIGKTAIDLGMTTDTGLRERTLARTLEVGSAEPGEVEVRTKTGNRIFVRHVTDRIDFGGRAFALATLQDVTAQRKAAEDLKASEAQLRLSEQRFRELAEQLNLIADNAPVSIAQIDRDYKYLFVNAGYASRLGKAREDIIGKTISQVIGDEAFARFKPYCDLALNGQASKFEASNTYPDIGLRRMSVAYVPYTDDAGTVQSFVGTVIDITDRYNAEQEVRRLNEELEEKVKDRTTELLQANEQLQGFTHSVAHDLRQQIRGISVNASLLLMDGNEVLSSENQEHLRRLVESAKQLSSLVDDLLRYAKLGRQEPRRVQFDLSELAESTAELLLTAGEYERAVEVNVQPGMVVVGDPAMLAIAVQNLLENALKYSQVRADPRILVGRDENGYYVRDNGIGFEMAYAAKIFEPFERLHSGGQYPGTGIGLANVRRIVEKHGGRVWADSRPGDGATFYFTIPDGAARGRRSAKQDAREPIQS